MNSPRGCKYSPLRDVHSGEEDKSDSMRDVMRRLRVLGELLGCTVWVSHHMPKANKDTAKRRPGQNLRGSSAIHGSIDSGLYIEPLDGDGTNVFLAQVTSQIKAGRSAGAFDLELAIVDDAGGAAECATWTFARADFRKGPAKANKDDDAVFAFVRELAMQGEDPHAHRPEAARLTANRGEAHRRRPGATHRGRPAALARRARSRPRARWAGVQRKCLKVQAMQVSARRCLH